MARTLAAAVTLMMLAGCTWFPTPDVSLGGIPCTIGPPPLGPSDRLNDRLGRWVLTVADSGKVLCDWKKPGER